MNRSTQYGLALLCFGCRDFLSSFLSTSFFLQQNSKSLFYSPVSQVSIIKEKATALYTVQLLTNGNLTEEYGNGRMRPTFFELNSAN